MKNILRSLLLVSTTSISATLSAQYAEFDWAALYTGQASSSKANDVAWTSPGVGHHLVTCGEFTGTIDVDMSATNNNVSSQGGSDIFITIQDVANNNPGWVIVLGSAGDDKALVVERTQDYNIIVAGSFSGTIDFDPGAGVTNLTSAGGTDGFIMKIDVTTGNLMWAVHAVAGPGDDAVTSLGFNAQGRITLGGYFDATADLDPSAAFTNVTSQGGSDIWISQYSSAGIFDVGTSFGATADDLLYDVSTGSFGQAVIAGGFSSSIDLDPGAGVQMLSTNDTTMFLLSLDSNLTYVNHGFLLTAKPGYIDFDPGLGRNIIYGSFKDSLNTSMDSLSAYLYSMGGYDVFLLTAFGHLNSTLDQYTFGGSGDDFVTATSNFSQNCIIAGVTNSPSFYFGTASNDSILQAGSGNDMFAFVLDYQANTVNNTGLAANNNALRNVSGATTYFTGSGFPIWLSGTLNGSCDFDPTVTNTPLTSSSTSEDGFVLSWNPCATVYAGTTYNICDSVYVYNNVTYSVPGTIIDTLTTVCGSDSIITINLMPLSPPNMGVIVSNFTLSATQSQASYQWVDCNSNFASIPGATSQSFTPTADGNYAVVISYGPCAVDTSVCVSIIGIGITEEILQKMEISPNPFTDYLIVSEAPIGAVVELYTILGEKVLSVHAAHSDVYIPTGHLAEGSYLLRISFQGKTQTRMLVK